MDSNSLYCKVYQARVKRAALELFGSKCERCGLDDHRTLQISAKGESQRTWKAGSNSFYRALLDGSVPKADYRCLCANCLWIEKAERTEQDTRSQVKMYAARH